MLTLALALVLHANPTPAIDQRFVAVVRDAAAKYQTWGRVDERAQVAPTSCAPAFAADGKPAAARYSSAGPHGKKLYYLWASDRTRYLALGERAAVDVGFAIVKQSFTTRPRKPTNSKRGMTFGAPEPIDWVTTPDGDLQTHKASDLFVMAKVGDGEGTDAGWVYGTLTSRGKVTGAGRLANCISCHEHAPRDRLFGLAATPQP